MQVTKMYPSSGPGQVAGFGEDNVGWVPAPTPASWTGASVQGSGCMVVGDGPWG